ncbi:flavin-containing monooxygenase 5-like [Bufo bufo]|uniref:flavin-containing monooxygenase 5-like n=1 Tax=Bufo bufo TaxID=8384 RepID=UPI001ABEACD8|nr:flavin-containing monooxygenase 5-like [Bufo bufo]XP_040262683.1 flavin-containing monooxygenase 5-like [Bufo bufo]XP_040262684.1 flavin-containing monooxygenase 5-like [Bufo bufo]
MGKKVAVIGAGASGLPAIKTCLDEGLEPTCFERSDDIGGLWRFKKDPEESRASIYNSVIINTSKEMMTYSDYPIPEDYPNYMHNSKVLEYFYQYINHFQLKKYIKFKTSVCSVKKRPDFATTGQWDVTTEHNGKQETHVFDAILVCVGHHTSPNLPLHSFPGIEKFKGHYFHSRDYKAPEEFKDKKVIVVGIGNTGVDLAVELSGVAKQVYLSTRRGAWLLNRVFDNGFPLDIVLFTRFFGLFQDTVPSLVNTFLERKVNSRVDHDNFGLKPQHRMLSQHPTISDDLPNRIISGKVLMKTNIKRFEETDVVFEDGTVEKDIDVVIFATGYKFSFSFFDDSVIKVEKNQAPLYKMMFLPHLEKPTVAFIGYVQPLGAIMPISEIQARWATKVFKGERKLPSMSEMKAEITKRKEDMKKRYVESERHTLQVDYVNYMDEVAEEIGCRPNVKKLFLSDPKLAWEILFGPCTPYQYRLCGPGQWKDARKAILTQYERIIKPMKTRSTSDKCSCGLMKFALKIFAILIVFAAIYIAV